MRTRIGVLAFIMISSASLVMAQTHISGAAECAGPAQVHVMRLSDHSNHFFVLSQGKCHWTTPIDIAGTKTQSDEATVSKEVRAHHARLRGYVTETTTSGDKFSYRIVGEQVLDHGKTVSEHGHWTIVSGTGKLKGIHGKGSYTGKLQGENMVFDLEGEYQAAGKHSSSRGRKGKMQ